MNKPSCRVRSRPCAELVRAGVQAHESCVVVLLAGVSRRPFRSTPSPPSWAALQQPVRAPVAPGPHSRQSCQSCSYLGDLATCRGGGREA
eukprot:353607-Chlamydomonas_euryale.AAC.1